MRAEKELLKQEIKDKINNFDAFLIMQYFGLTANVANELRREIGKTGGDIEVVRKGVFLKAADDVGIAIDLASLPGHVGVVFLGEDPIESTKTLFKFSQEREKVIQVLGGRFDGKMVTGADVERLSTLPGKDGMRAQLLGLFEAPLSQTLAVFEALLASVPYCLDNKAKEETSGTKDETSGDDAV